MTVVPVGLSGHAEWWVENTTVSLYDWNEALPS
jgi:hypothetical protein